MLYKSKLNIYFYNYWYIYIANELKDLPLAVNKINKEHLSNAPYILHKAIIKKLKVKVPGLGSITKNPIEITISGLEVITYKKLSEFIYNYTFINKIYSNIIGGFKEK